MSSAFDQGFDFTTIHPATERTRVMPHDKLMKYFESICEGMQNAVIIVNGRNMHPLLPKSPGDLREFWDRGLSVIGFIPGGEGSHVIAHAAIEPLCIDPETGEQWYELGAVWVHPDVRGKQDLKRDGHKHIGLRLYRAILELHPDKNIMCTTINPAAMIVGARMDMVAIRYSDLPNHVWNTTCCCPTQKTGVAREQNVPNCTLRSKACFVRVTKETWERMGRPEPIALPVIPKQYPIKVPKDGVTFHSRRLN